MNEPLLCRLKWYAAWQRSPSVFEMVELVTDLNWSALTIYEPKANKITCTHANSYSCAHPVVCKITISNILLQFLQAPFNSCIQIKNSTCIELIEIKCWMPRIDGSLDIETKICINFMFYISFHEWLEKKTQNSRK